MGVILFATMRLLALLLVFFIVYNLHSLLKRIIFSKIKIMYRILIIVFDVFFIVVTLIPCYLIHPGKINCSGFNDLISYVSDNANISLYCFETQNYEGTFAVDNINCLNEYLNLVEEFSPYGIVFEGEDDNVNWVSAPIVAKRDLPTLGCCSSSNVESQVLLWDENNVIYITYWYVDKYPILNFFTFPELFNRKKIDLNEIIDTVTFEMKTWE